MDVITELLIFTLALISEVSCRQCTYIFDSGYIKYFICEDYEYCCGTRCCQSHPVTFYQVWYFWLIVFMTLLLCSGGSWWYRFHNRDSFISSPPIVITGRPVATQPGVSYGATPSSQQYYPQQAVLPQQQQPPPPPPQCPPPPYYEHPPSYASVTNRGS